MPLPRYQQSLCRCRHQATTVEEVIEIVHVDTPVRGCRYRDGLGTAEVPQGLTQIRHLRAYS